MLSATHSQCILNLTSQKGLLRANELDKLNMPRVVLTRLIAAGIAGQGRARSLSVARFSELRA